jgi:hypothetical protein
MASSKIKIANLALSKIGERAITSFIQEGSNQARVINEVWDDVLEEVLSEHPWSFAQKRIALSYSVPDDVSRTIQERIYTPVVITGATAAEPVVITAADHGLEDGERIKILGVVGMTQLNGNFYRVDNKTDDTFELIDEETEEDIDGTGYTAYTSGGKIYLANDSDPLNITGATAANPVVLTAAAHGLSDGDWIFVQGVAGMTELNGNFYIVDNATTNTFSLQDTDEADVNGLSYTAYVSGGQILEAIDLPALDTGTVVVYAKPSDMIKPIRKSEKNAYISIEDGKIISDTEDLKMKYTYRCTDTTRYFPKFTQALATRLAAEIAFRITNSVQKAELLHKDYNERILPGAISVDSTQGTPDEIDQNEWLDSMIIGSGAVATTGETWHPV